MEATYDNSRGAWSTRLRSRRLNRANKSIVSSLDRMSLWHDGRIAYPQWEPTRGQADDACGALLCRAVV